MLQVGAAVAVAGGRRGRAGHAGVGPGGVAAHALSLRSLHKLFEPHETTVAGWVRRRRLERCRRDLVDPALRSRLVSAIGARWGLANPAHFSRLFRAAYGLSPTRSVYLE